MLYLIIVCSHVVCGKKKGYTTYLGTVQEVRIFRYSGPCLDLIAELYPGTDSTIERNFTCSEAQSWQGEDLLFILILVDSTEWKFKYSDTYY